MENPRLGVHTIGLPGICCVARAWRRRGLSGRLVFIAMGHQAPSPLGGRLLVGARMAHSASFRRASRAASVVPKRVGEREYWKRSGDSFYRMDHFDIADMFGQRRRPALRFDWRAACGNVVDQMHQWHLVLILANDGRGLARFPMIEVELPRRLSIYEYGLAGNRDHGLRWQPVDPAHGRHRFQGGTGDVVPPGVGLDVTRVAGLYLLAHRNCPWEYKPEEIRIAYRVVAENAPLREDVLHFRVEDEV